MCFWTRVGVSCGGSPVCRCDLPLYTEHGGCRWMSVQECPPAFCSCEVWQLLGCNSVRYFVVEIHWGYRLLRMLPDRLLVCLMHALLCCDVLCCVVLTACNYQGDPLAQHESMFIFYLTCIMTDCHDDGLLTCCHSVGRPMLQHTTT